MHLNKGVKKINTKMKGEKTIIKNEREKSAITTTLYILEKRNAALFFCIKQWPPPFLMEIKSVVLECNVILNSFNTFFFS